MSLPVQVSVGVCALLLVAGVATAQSRDAPIPHDVGQSVTPAFEGWFPNADGTFSLSFGYMNRNFKETLDIPIGPGNAFDVGPADQGQPTHFLPRRQAGVFTVVVPADFGDRQLTWTLASGGETIAIPGHLRPEWEIDALHEITSGNRPPMLKFDPDAEATQGPGGARSRLEASTGRPVTLDVWASDDGIKKRQSPREPVLGVAWSKYRGPGDVDLGQARPQIDAHGHATTTATFSEPGSYMLRVLVWDDSGPQGQIMAGGFQCCWTNGFVEITVR